MTKLEHKPDQTHDAEILPSGITFRKATVSDWDTIKEIEAASFEVNVVPAVMRQVISEERGAIYLAEADGKPVAYQMVVF